MTQHIKTIAAILAGGASRRMGRDKSFIEVDGVMMIERVIGAVKPVCSDIVIIANQPEGFHHLNLPIYPDIITGMGPLSGLHSAFANTGADEIFLAACDMPYISPAVAEKILAYPMNGFDAAIPFVNGLEQGLLARYSTKAMERFNDRIAEGSIKFDEFRKGLHKTLIGEEVFKTVDSELRSFINLNSPEDMEQLSRRN
ncbi:MAG: molybdenum cofactor guanylyltransferase [Nitrospinae bacterium]|nr:molybdenum cofactor guanylyltransferase [Nitrospinota bacterium]